jgi:hypothetical protein
VLLVAVISNVGTEDWLMPLGVAWDRSKPEGYLEARRSPTTLFNRVGFALDNVRYQTCQLRGFACPYWFITLLTAILPAARLVGCWRRARRLRMRPGICQYCGYDCRATPDRCPECGSRIAAAR